MRIQLAYGRNGLVVDLPDERTTVIEPTFVPGLPDPEGALRTALRNPIGTPPLRRIVDRGQTIAISVCDVTRPMPSATVLPVLLAELPHVPDDQIVILVATGTHRGNTAEELDEMLGREVTRRYEVVNHSAFDDSGLERVGDTPDGIPIWLDSRWVGADFKITTGFVEPHFFAGFSGGPKMVAPGLAGLETVMHLHSAPLIGHERSKWGITEGNPIHDAIRQIAQQTGVDFALDVTINRNRQITSAYAGELFAEHEAATAVARRSAMRGVPHPFDVVVTTNSGYPLDLNLYQTVKGMSAAAQVVRDGGSIVCASECSDGIPEHGEYGKMLAESTSLDQLARMVRSPGFSRHDQWQVQLQAEIQQRANVYLKSDFLTDSQVRGAYLEPIEDVESKVMELAGACGDDATICVLPEGPQTIPYLI